MAKTNYPVFNELVDFFSTKKLKIYEKGQLILYAGDKPSGVFYIEKGHVKAYSLSEKGEERIHMFFKKNEIFPLIWPFKKFQNNIFYQAMETVAVRIAEEEEFHEFVHKDPEIMHAIVHRLIDIIDVFIDRVDNLQSEKSYKRLVARLLFLAKRFGTRDGDGITIEVPITHLDIANTIALTRETVSRDMGILLEKGVISQKKHLITIKNLDLLKQELHQEE